MYDEVTRSINVAFLGRERTGCFFLQSGTAAPGAGAALSG
jgi:hypothetical protein